MLDTELTFSDHNGHLVVIMDQVAQRLISHRQLHCFSKEAAGILIGERRGPHLIICELSEPGLGDLRHRFSVNRKGQHHQTRVLTAFTQSDGTKQYLGEWHTHPEDNPTPSSRDICSWQEHIDDSSPMILLIVGRKNIWLGKMESGVITSLAQSQQ